MMKPHILYISAPEAPSTLLGFGNLALFICFMSFQKFLKSLLHSLEASLSAYYTPLRTFVGVNTSA